MPSPGFRDGLPAEAKLAWQYLYLLTGGRVEVSHVIVIAAIAAALGTTDRSSRRALGTLVKIGLVEILERYQGRYTIYMHDPLIVARARLMPGESHGQGELDFADEPTSPPEDGNAPARALPLAPGIVSPSSPGTASAVPADVASCPPADVASCPPADVASCPPADVASCPPKPHTHRGGLNVIRTSHIHIPSAREDVYVRRGGSGATSAARSEPPKTPGPRIHQEPPGPQHLDAVFNESFEKWAARAGATGQIGEGERLAAWIHQRVADPKLHMALCRRVAALVVIDRFPRTDLQTILGGLNEKSRAGELRIGRGAYFWGAVKRFCSRRGILEELQGRP